MALPDGPLKSAVVYCCGGCVCLSILFGVVSVITVLASIKTLAPDEQMVVHYLDGKQVVNGPCTKVFNPFRDKDRRKLPKLGPLQFVRVKNKLDGAREIKEGPQLIKIGAYDEYEGPFPKIVLRKDQYIRFLNQLSGKERVLVGPQTVTPGAWEVSDQGVQQAAFVNTDSAVLVLNKETGVRRLVSTPGVFFPSAYEVVVEQRRLIRVLPHESLVVRNQYGLYTVYSGSSGNGQGTSFFLQPYNEIAAFEWSTFSQPTAGVAQQIGKERVERIDMRSRTVFYQYEVRTNDNVALRLEGTIFWKVVNVFKMLNITSDPAGDVWFHARSALNQAVSKETLSSFMSNFNNIVMAAFNAQAADGFYDARGVQVMSMEVTRYECVDAEVAATLQEIIQETTNRINRLQVQKSTNEVRIAKLNSEITLEQQRTLLIQAQAKNQRTSAEQKGEAEGLRLAVGATTFIDGLDSSLPDLDQRLNLYKMHQKLENQNQKTAHLAQGKATLFLTPEEMNLKMKPQEL